MLSTSAPRQHRLALVDLAAHFDVTLAEIEQRHDFLS
jgi:hypothetical protein